MADVEFDEKTILKHLRTFRKSTSWITKNVQKLRSKYPDQYVAVYDRKVIGTDLDFDLLFKRLEGKYNMSHVVIEFIPSEELILVL
ncbi:MAG: DUF5678 domain-containing protein [Thermoplasmata archaeon]